MLVKYQRNPQTAGRIIDAMVFVLTPDDNMLHTLNQTATRLWILAGESGGTTAEQVADDLVARFQVDKARALDDVATCVQDLLRRRILVESA